MRLSDKYDIMALVDEDEITTKFNFDLTSFKEIKAWAVKGIEEDYDGDYWPVIEGKVLKWSYLGNNVRSLILLLKTFGRDFSFLTNPEFEMPLLIKIEKYEADKTQKYIMIAPRIEAIT